MVSDKDHLDKKFAWHNDPTLNAVTSNTRRKLANDRARANKESARQEKRFQSGRRKHK